MNARVHAGMDAVLQVYDMSVSHVVAPAIQQRPKDANEKKNINDGFIACPSPKLCRGRLRYAVSGSSARPIIVPFAVAQ